MNVFFGFFFLIRGRLKISNTNPTEAKHEVKTLNEIKQFGAD